MNKNNDASRGSMETIDSRSLSNSKKIFIYLIIAASLFLLFYINAGQKTAKNKPEEERQRAVNFPAHNANLDLAETPPPEAESVTPPPSTSSITIGNLRDQTSAFGNSTVESEEDSIMERKMRGGFNNTSGISTSSSQQLSGTTTPKTREIATMIEQPANSQQFIDYDGQGVARVSATRIPNRSLVITQGSKIQCTLETALDSSVPGMTSCIIGEDIYSADGRVRLIDRGSKLNGRYEGELRQGKARIAILWERLETPEGVLVNLSSPSTDVLGRTGADGYVDKHFWERFGNAIMLSLISDAFQYANTRNNGRESPLRDTEQSTQEMAQIALEHEIDVSPTLHKNHGEPIMVFLNKDLSFEKVYSLSLNPTQNKQPDFKHFKRFREQQFK